MAMEDEIDQYEYFVGVAESLVWRNAGRFVLLDGNIIPNAMSIY